MESEQRVGIWAAMGASIITTLDISMSPVATHMVLQDGPRWEGQPASKQRLSLAHVDVEK